MSAGGGGEGPPAVKGAAFRLPEGLPGVNLEAALRRVVGNHLLLRSLLVQFGCEHAGTLARLRDEIAAGQLTDAECRAHLLKGVAGNLGLFAVAASGQALCGALRRDEREALPELLDRLDRDLGPALGSCAHLADDGGALSEGGAEITALTDAELNALFDELSGLLRSFNTRAEEQAALLHRALAGSPHLERVREMSAALDRFNFRRALAILEELRAAVTA